MAKLYFRYGSMNCGKTTSLLQVYFNYEERNQRPFLIKPKIDKKGNNEVVSRIGISRTVDLLIDDTENIFDIISEHILKESIDCIIVDEVQFLTKEQIDQLLLITVYLDIPVICYGLRTDFKLNGFPGSERLLLIAHSIEEMKTICECGKKASHVIRKVNGEITTTGDQVVIDNDDKIEYTSVCSVCYFKVT